jgi:hypothetical protein
MAEPDAKIPNQNSKQHFESARSQLLDAFATLEVAIKRKTPDVDSNAEIKKVRSVRNDLVHSQLKILPGKPAYAVYLNSALVGEEAPLARMMTLDQHKGLMTRLKALTAKIAT